MWEKIFSSSSSSCAKQLQAGDRFCVAMDDFNPDAATLTISIAKNNGSPTVCLGGGVVLLGQLEKNLRSGGKLNSS